MNRPDWDNVDQAEEESETERRRSLIKEFLTALHVLALLLMWRRSEHGAMVRRDPVWKPPRYNGTA